MKLEAIKADGAMTVPATTHDLHWRIPPWRGMSVGETRLGCGLFRVALGNLQLVRCLIRPRARFNARKPQPSASAAASLTPHGLVATATRLSGAAGAPLHPPGNVTVFDGGLALAAFTALTAVDSTTDSRIEDRAGIAPGMECAVESSGL